MIWIFLSTVKNIKDEEKGNEPVHKIVKTYVLKHRIHQLNKNVYKKKKKILERIMKPRAENIFQENKINVLTNI